MELIEQNNQRKKLLQRKKERKKERKNHLFRINRILNKIMIFNLKIQSTWMEN